MSSRTDHASSSWLPALALTVAIGAALRLWGLGSGLWYDEIVTLVRSARLPIREIATTFPGVNAHPFYSVLAHGSITLLGESAWALRLPAMLFGLASIGMVYALGVRLMSAAEAWASSSVLAVSYHHIWFSQNARGYTLLGLATLISTWLIVRMLARPAPRDFAAYALVAALGVYTHLTMAFVVAAHWFVLLVAWSRRTQRSSVPLLHFTAAVAAAAVLSIGAYAPFASAVAEALSAAEPHEAAAVATPSWAAVALARSFAGGPGILATLVGLSLAALGLAALLRRAWLECALLVAPALTTLVVLIALGQPVRPRFFFFLSGAAAIFVGKGMGVVAERVTPGHKARTRRRTVLIVAMVCACAALCMPGLSRNYAAPKQDFDRAVAFLDDEARQGQAIVVAGPACLPIAEFYEKTWPCLRNARDWDSVVERRDVLLAYTLPDYIADGALRARVEQRCTPTRSFPGTLDGGDITVCRVSSSEP